MSSLRIAKRQCDYLKIKPFRITMTLNKGILYIFVYGFELQVIGILNLRVFFDPTSHKKSVGWLTQ